MKRPFHHNYLLQLLVMSSLIVGSVGIAALLDTEDSVLLFDRSGIIENSDLVIGGERTYPRKSWSFGKPEALPQEFIITYVVEHSWDESEETEILALTSDGCIRIGKTKIPLEEVAAIYRDFRELVEVSK